MDALEQLKSLEGARVLFSEARPGLERAAALLVGEASGRGAAIARLEVEFLSRGRLAYRGTASIRGWLAAALARAVLPGVAGCPAAEDLASAVERAAAHPHARTCAACADAVRAVRAALEGQEAKAAPARSRSSRRLVRGGDGRSTARRAPFRAGARVFLPLIAVAGALGGLHLARDRSRPERPPVASASGESTPAPEARATPPSESLPSGPPSAPAFAGGPAATEPTAEAAPPPVSSATPAPAPAEALRTPEPTPTPATPERGPAPTPAATRSPEKAAPGTEVAVRKVPVVRLTGDLVLEWGGGDARGSLGSAEVGVGPDDVLRGSGTLLIDGSPIVIDGARIRLVEQDGVLKLVLAEGGVVVHAPRHDPSKQLEVDAGGAAVQVQGSARVEHDSKKGLGLTVVEGRALLRPTTRSREVEVRAGERATVARDVVKKRTATRAELEHAAACGDRPLAAWRASDERVHMHMGTRAGAATERVFASAKDGSTQTICLSHGTSPHVYATPLGTLRLVYRGPPTLLDVRIDHDVGREYLPVRPCDAAGWQTLRLPLSGCARRDPAANGVVRVRGVSVTGTAAPFEILEAIFDANAGAGRSDATAETVVFSFRDLKRGKTPDTLERPVRGGRAETIRVAAGEVVPSRRAAGKLALKADAAGAIELVPSTPISFDRPAPPSGHLLLRFAAISQRTLTIKIDVGEELVGGDKHELWGTDMLWNDYPAPVPLSRLDGAHFFDKSLLPRAEEPFLLRRLRLEVVGAKPDARPDLVELEGLELVSCRRSASAR